MDSTGEPMAGWATFLRCRTLLQDAGQYWFSINPRAMTVHRSYQLAIFGDGPFKVPTADIVPLSEVTLPAEINAVFDFISI